MMGTRAHYRYDLAEIQRALLQLSAAVQQAVISAVRALLRNEIATAHRVIREDAEIDLRRADVEERVLRVITSQQPVADDLRFLLAAIRIADELERMGDYAEGMAALVVREAHTPMIVPPPQFETLIAQASANLAASVQAFVERNSAAAAQLEQADDYVDDLYRTVQAALLQHIHTTPQEAQQALYLLFAAHNLERVADRAVNIAERTAFIATGARPARHMLRDEG